MLRGNCPAGRLAHQAFGQNAVPHTALAKSQTGHAVASALSLAGLHGEPASWRIRFKKAMTPEDNKLSAATRAGGRRRIERRLAAVLSLDVQGYSQYGSLRRSCA